MALEGLVELHRLKPKANDQAAVFSGMGVRKDCTLAPLAAGCCSAVEMSVDRARLSNTGIQ